MLSLDTDNFIKITCDWQGTCNRFFLRTKQIIDNSLFSVAGYCWVYLGVGMFCIRVVIIMLSSVLAWMYAVIERGITNHNMWPIFSTNISLRELSYFRLFLLHGHLKIMRAMDIWTRSICGYTQEFTVLCVKALRFIMYTLNISRSFFSWKKLLKLTTKNILHWWKIGCRFKV